MSGKGAMQKRNVINHYTMVEEESCALCMGKHSSNTWYDENDEIHREDGPAQRWHACLDVDLHEYHMSWYRHNKLHRVNGPARVMTRISTDKHRMNGGGVALRLFEWWIDGKLHNVTGPSRVQHYSYGKPYTIEDWWIDGMMVDMDKLAAFCELPIEEQVAIKLMF